MSSKAHVEFSPVSELFISSWHLMMKKAFKLVALQLFSFCVSIAIVPLVTLVFLFAIYPQLARVPHDQIALLQMVSSSGFIFFAGLLLIIVVILELIIGAATQAGIILAVSDKGNNSFKTYFRNGVMFVLPILGVTALAWVVIFGASILLIIPGLIVSFYMSFAIYEVVLEHKTGRAALRSSAMIITQHASEIFIRVVLVWAAYLLIMYVFTGKAQINVAHYKNGGTQGFNLLGIVVNMITGWYYICFQYNLYKEARAAYNDSSKISVRWIKLLALIGWVLLLVAVAAFLYFTVK